MTGVEKIIARIEEDCYDACGDIISKAQAEAQSILADAESRAEELKTEKISAVKAKCETEIGLAKSKAEQEYKKAILSAKIGIITEIIDEVKNRLKNMPDSEYFEVIAKLVERHAQNGCGELRFSKRDLQRLPKDFEANINKKLSGSGKTFTVGSQPEEIDGGVVIAYGDIEQNCSFDSLLNASLDEIKDELFAELFAGDGS
jgi:V/A-type H+-transporting ATPase subunit E